MAQIEPRGIVIPSKEELLSAARRRVSLPPGELWRDYQDDVDKLYISLKEKTNPTHSKSDVDDIFLLKRQIRGGTKQGIPDIVGLDKDGNICIIEMKNVTVDASIIPQVLQYAFWAETNPDSIKSLWLEVETKPDDLSVSWDDFEVRIIVIAPTILRSTLDC